MNWILSSPMLRNESPTLPMSVIDSKSVCSELVAALRKPTTRLGRVSVPAETTLLAMAAMNACCRLTRPMSDPSPRV